MAQTPGVAIRPESTDDHDAIRRVVAAAFQSDVEAELVARIRSSPEYVAEMALVAEVDDSIVGHVMISHAALRHDAGERQISMLSPLAVVPDRQRQGIGTALVRAVLDVAETRGEPLVVLEGNPTYYGRLGFEHAVRYGIKIRLPEWAPPEAGQVMRLVSYKPDDPSLRGTVIHPKSVRRPGVGAFASLPALPVPEVPLGDELAAGACFHLQKTFGSARRVDRRRPAAEGGCSPSSVRLEQDAAVDHDCLSLHEAADACGVTYRTL
jgi:putative acetyltransferase